MELRAAWPRATQQKHATLAEQSRYLLWPPHKWPDVGTFPHKQEIAVMDGIVGSLDHCQRQHQMRVSLCLGR